MLDVEIRYFSMRADIPLTRSLITKDDNAIIP